MFHQELFSRFMMLSSDCERVIKLEVAYNLKFIIRENFDDKFIKQNFIKLIESYINEDDLFLKTETFFSLIKILKRINDDSFINLNAQKILTILDTNNTFADLGFLIKIFEFVVCEYEHITKHGIMKNFYNIVKIFIKVKIS
jgi:hypothetical protein